MGAHHDGPVGQGRVRQVQRRGAHVEVVRRRQAGVHVALEPDGLAGRRGREREPAGFRGGGRHDEEQRGDEDGSGNNDLEMIITL